MGMLSGLNDKLQGVQGRLQEADDMNYDMDSKISSRMDATDKKLEENLESVLKKQSEQAVFATAVHQTSLQVVQNIQVMLQGMLSDIKVVERKLGEKTDKLSSEVGNVKSGVGSSEKATLAQLKSIADSLAKLPTQFPEQIKTDLSGLERDIKAVGMAVKNIPTTKIPPAQDISPFFKKLENKIDKRVHTFDIKRDNNDQIKTITVRTV